MRALIVVAVIVLIMIGLGWITFRNGGDATNIQIETQKMKDDTEKAIDKGKEFFDEAGQRTREAVDKLDNEEDEPTTAPRSR